MITPEEQERRRLKNRAWQGYSLLVDGLEKKAQDADGKSLRSHPELKAILKEVASKDLRKVSESWWVEYNNPKGGDRAYKYAYGLNKIVSNKDFMEKYGNTKLWTDVKDFTTIRNTFTTFYKSLPERDPRKTKTQDAYAEILERFSETWHPKLKEIIIRNFSEDMLKDAQ